MTEVRARPAAGGTALVAAAVDAPGNFELSYVRAPQSNQILVMFDQVP